VTTNFRETLTQLLKARFPILYVETYEEARAYGIIDDVISSRQTADMTGPITRAS